MNEHMENSFRNDIRKKHPSLQALQGEDLEKRMCELGKSKKICIVEKDHRKQIIDVLMCHLNYHSFVSSGWRDEEALSREDPREMWMISTQEMFEVCRDRGESWAWEYLWKNWYRPDRWTVWARAISTKLPIISSNGIVESLWSVLKKQYLRKHNRPKMEFLVSILIDEYIPNHSLMIQQHRKLGIHDKPIKPVW
jgi:hypothetical protein